MPIFEYRCQRCKHEFETIVYSSTTVTCPKCESAKVKKLLSTFAHQSGGKMKSSHSHGCGSCSSSGSSCGSCGCGHKH